MLTDSGAKISARNISDAACCEAVISQSDKLPAGTHTSEQLVLSRHSNALGRESDCSDC